MSLKVTDLGTPMLFHEGPVRNWWRFGDGQGSLAVTEGPGPKGHTFRCDCSPVTHNCVHIRALERHLGVLDFRNDTSRTHEERDVA